MRAARTGPYRQSERLELYRAHAARLLQSGQAYYCFCTAEQLEADRAQALAAAQPPKYVGRCRGLDPAESAGRVAAGDAAVIRFKVPTGRDVSFQDVVRGSVTFSSDVIGDPVLVRSDGMPAYNFAVVVDDALMAITHVIRGEDHVSNTPRQVLLYEAFGYPAPAFAHLSLVLGPDHSPLSKRHGATSVAEFREKGYLPEALVNYLALIGWSPGSDEELLPAGELARRFRLEDVGHSAGIFDEDKLAWVNRHYLKLADPARLGGAAGAVSRGRRRAAPSVARGAGYIRSLLPMITTSVDRLAQAPGRLRFVFGYDAASSARDAAIAAQFAAEAPRYGRARLGRGARILRPTRLARGVPAAASACATSQKDGHSSTHSSR